MNAQNRTQPELVAERLAGLQYARSRATIRMFSFSAEAWAEGGSRRRMISDLTSTLSAYASITNWGSRLPMRLPFEPDELAHDGSVLESFYLGSLEGSGLLCHVILSGVTACYVDVDYDDWLHRSDEFFRLGASLFAVLQPRFGYVHVAESAPAPVDEDGLADYVMFATTNLRHETYERLGPLGVGLRTWFGRDAAGLIRSHPLEDATARIVSLPAGGIQMDVLPSEDLAKQELWADGWRKTVRALRRVGLLAGAAPSGRRPNYSRASNWMPEPQSSWRGIRASEAVSAIRALAETRRTKALARDIVVAGLDLSHADFSEIQVEALEAEGTSFRGSDLRRSIMVDCDLADADLRGVVFGSARLSDSVISGADARYADFANADLALSVARHTRFDHATLDGAVLPDDLTGACFRYATLRGARTERGTTLAGADFRDSDLRGADLRNCDLVGCRFDGALMDGVNLAGARLDKPLLG